MVNREQVISFLQFYEFNEFRGKICRFEYLFVSEKIEIEREFCNRCEFSNSILYENLIFQRERIYSGIFSSLV